MEPSSWLEHFRNLNWPNGNWHCSPPSRMITVQVSVGPYFLGAAGKWRFKVLKGLATIRRARRGAVCAILLACASFAVAGAREKDAAVNASAKPAAKTKAPASSTKRKTSSSGKSSSTRTAASGKRSSSRKKSAKARGQQKIDSERAQAIQEALIREHYLSGEASGTWNQASEEAMRRYQADQGWQTKQVPDSRALIRLGLGPNKDHLLNPESAMTTSPDMPRATSADPTSRTPAPVSDRTTTDAAPAATSGQHDTTGPQ